MFGLLHLADGSAEYVPNAERFESLVYEKLGRDAAEIVRTLINDGDIVTATIDSDFRAYESENEAMTAAIQQAIAEASRLQRYIDDEQRLNKAEVGEKLTQIIDALVNYG